MRFCIRCEIDLSNSEERLRKVCGVPVEISVGLLMRQLLENRHWLMDIRRQVQELGISVLSVHVPLVSFTDELFRKGARLIIAFAEAVGAEVVVFQPGGKLHGNRTDEQAAMLQNIKVLQDRTKVTIALETFWEGDSVLTPDEIMENCLPMVLDTSIIPKTEITWIVESYRTHIVNVHLSAVIPGGGEHKAGRQYRPVENDAFCLDVLDRLYDLEWHGIVTLEYMPWLADKSIEDRKLLEHIYSYSS
jgi:sugar phosphate isomerase/epimerase